jgi:hypothetical protein
VTQENVDLRTGEELIRQMFAAKDVPLSFLGEIETQREFHRQGWSAVQNAVKKNLASFDEYFDFVLTEIEKLKPVWNP